MDLNSIASTADNISMMICQEAKSKNEKPKLITNIAFSKYNKYLNFDPASLEAALITSHVNYLILRMSYESDLQRIGYTEPNKEYLENPEEWNVNQYSDGQYGFEEKPRRS